MDKKIKNLFKNSELSNFDKLVLALVKFYPKPKKQRELCLEAGITESELSGWIRGRRGKKYEEFFDKYCDYDKKVKGWRLKVHEDLLNKLLEIIRKDDRAKEVIGKSKYLKDLASRDLELLLKALNEGIIDLEKAKELFLEMLEANGITKDEISKKLGSISKGVLSYYLKIYLQFLSFSNKTFSIPLPTIEELVDTLKNDKGGIVWYDFIKNFGGIMGWYLVRRISLFFGRYLTLPSPYLIGDVKGEEKEFIEYLAKRDDKYRTFLIDLSDSYLLEKAGKPLKTRKWVKIGCIIFLFEFDLKALVDSNFKSSLVKVKTIGNILINPCPLDNNTCNLKISERFSCPKFRKLLETVGK